MAPTYPPMLAPAVFDAASAQRKRQIACAMIEWFAQNQPDLAHQFAWVRGQLTDHFCDASVMPGGSEYAKGEAAGLARAADELLDTRCRDIGDARVLLALAAKWVSE